MSNYGYAAYSSSKFGVVGLASALRIECKTQGIVVSAICPPEVPTPMVDEERRTAPAVTMQTKQFAGTVTLPDLCRQVMHGLERDRFMIVPGSWRARFTVFMAANLSDGCWRASRTGWWRRLCEPAEAAAPCRQQDATATRPDRLLRRRRAAHRALVPRCFRLHSGRRHAVLPRLGCTARAGSAGRRFDLLVAGRSQRAFPDRAVPVRGSARDD